MIISAYRMSGRRSLSCGLVASALLPLLGAAMFPSPVDAGGTSESAVQIALKDAASCLRNNWPKDTLQARLICLGQVDQAGRTVLFLPAVQLGSPGASGKSDDHAWADIFAYDLKNQRRLSTLLPRHGWFRRRDVGGDAADAAFLVVQHAENNRSLMRQTLRAMEPLLGTPDLDAQQYALLSDRIAVADHRSQSFGTQWRCADGAYTLIQPADDERLLNQRRWAIGIKQTVAENQTDIVSRYPRCP
jgi:hypothetical protein